ncbi:MAG: DUF3419 family protein [Gemmatimonadota bacterium]
MRAASPDRTRERPIQERASFDLIRYGSVWEDADVLCQALRPVAKDGRLLSIGSAGDNALALLTLDPAEVVVVDLSLAQLACLAIRVAAFRELDDAELLGFLGVSDSPERLRRYGGLRNTLPEFARVFWDARASLIADGVIHAGKLEAYFRTFRRHVLPLIHSRKRVEALFQPRPYEEREAYYSNEWDSWRWRLLMRLFFSRAVMGRLGRDPAFFRHVDGPVASRVLERARHGFTKLPTHTNPYLTYILTGAYGPDALPRYLRPEHRSKVRERLGRIRMHHGPVDDVEDGFDGFNLSDIFEYMSPAQHETCYGALVKHANPGARMVYWNLLAPRGTPDQYASRIRPMLDYAHGLHQQDRAWFYQALHVDEVLDDG